MVFTVREGHGYVCDDGVSLYVTQGGVYCEGHGYVCDGVSL